ncbi:MAG TPA: hypothetical protein VMV12_08935 [Candidatus Micrarchaeaceae archaeon]|nr:hypothetical protein [Candidatus Micrarchaeaceae archaeon]
MQDLAIDLDSHERAMSTAAEALAEAGINIEGMTGPMNGDELSLGHMLFENSADARRVLEAAGLKVVAERDVVVVPLEDRAGALWELLQRIGPRSYDLVYLATGSRVVLGGQAIEEVARTLATGA